MVSMSVTGYMDNLPSQLEQSGFVQSRGMPLLYYGVPSYLCIGLLPYYRDEPEDLSEPDDPHGLIAPFARRNYYHIAVEKLQYISLLLRRYSGYRKREIRIFCNSRIPEKVLAASAGSGDYGKNGLILSPERGSLTVIAGLIIRLREEHTGGFSETRLIDIQTAEQQVASRGFPLCGSCTACMDACPTGAITEPAVINRTLCLQSLSTAEQAIRRHLQEKWGYILYGCQICQQVCPLNRNPESGIEESDGTLGPSLSLKEVLSWSATELSDRIEGTVLHRSWINPLVLQRNALIAGGNRENTSLLPWVTPFLHSREEWIRDAARYCVSRLT